ncbi:MAG TPA: hypothetical protein VL854_09740 [Nitrososphaeraceae archaeon]|nr:hypothetical protein [Nitrososphaeraceae archaeon]
MFNLYDSEGELLATITWNEIVRVERELNKDEITVVTDSGTWKCKVIKQAYA